MFKNKDLKSVVLALAGANGTSGNENEAALLAKSMLEEYMPAHIDTLGSVCGDTGGDGVHIMLDAHIDRIGMTVTAIDDSGFIKFARVGGMDARVLAAEQVTVWGDEPFFGVITSTPPHLASGDDDKKAKKIEDLSIDVGMTADEVKKIVRSGMRITVNSTPKELLGGRVSCAALDDRAGVAAILRCLELLKDKITDAASACCSRLRRRRAAAARRRAALRLHPMRLSPLMSASPWLRDSKRRSAASSAAAR